MIKIAALLLFTSLAQAVTFVEPNLKQAFSVTTPAFAPPAAATDVCILNGSATKKVTVIGVELYSNQTTTGANEYWVIKRSTADTAGGGANAVTPVPWDSGYAAATATFQYWINSNPTSLGTTVGVLEKHRNVSPVSTGLQSPMFQVLTNSQLRYQPVVLRGTGEGLAVNLNGITVTGLSIGCTFNFIEE